MTRREKILAAVAAFLLVFAPVLNLLADTVVSAGGGASTGTVVFSANTETATGGALVLKGDVAAGVSPAVTIDNVTAQTGSTTNKVLSINSGGSELDYVDTYGYVHAHSAGICFEATCNAAAVYGGGSQVSIAATGIVFNNYTAGFIQADNAGNLTSVAMDRGQCFASTGITTGAIFGQTLFTNASTITATGTNVAPFGAVGVGAGNYVAKACSDGATCGAGNVYVTYTAACNDALGASDVIAGTLTKSAVPANTTLSWSLATACTSDAFNVCIHATTP